MKKVPPVRLRTIRLLKRLRRQLEAMNASEAHAVSWIEPRSTTTKLAIRAITNHLEEL